MFVSFGREKRIVGGSIIACFLKFTLLVVIPYSGLKFDVLYAKTLLLTIKKKNAKSEIIIYLFFLIYIFHLIIIVCIL